MGAGGVLGWGVGGVWVVSGLDCGVGFVGLLGFCGWVVVGFMRVVGLLS